MNNELSAAWGHRSTIICCHFHATHGEANKKSGNTSFRSEKVHFYEALCGSVKKYMSQ